MNYRHAFHAGNFADIVKHTVLLVLLEALNRKPAPWCYFDCHAGAGLYDLHSDEAARSSEAVGGIGRLWPLRNQAPAAVAELCAAVAAVNPGLAAGALPRFYPGSPLIAAGLARAQDRLILAELQLEEARVLRTHFRRDARVAVHVRDGYEMLKALTPPPERRGLALLDPPFEQPTEFTQLLQSLRIAQRRWPEGVQAAWYPLKDQPAVRRFERELLRADIRRILLAEFRLALSDVPGLHACGMALINPPWQTEQALRQALEFLVGTLSSGSGSSRVWWLVEE